MDVQTLLKPKTQKNIPQLRSGQVVRVHERIKEKGKERIQVFEGLVISVKHGRGLDGTFAVRKIAAGGVGVERTFPLHMPSIAKIEVLRQEKVRRAKLYYVRGQVGKKTKKRKSKMENLIYDMGGEKEEETTDEEEKPEEEVKKEKKEPKEEKQEETASDEKEEKQEEQTEEKTDKKENVKEEAPKKEEKEDSSAETSEEEEK